MHSVRELPPSLLRSLRCALELEQLVDPTAEVIRWRRAVEAASVLMLSAFNAGWQAKEIAAAIHQPEPRVRARIARTRRRLGGHAPALIVDEPLPERPHPRAVLRLPLEQRAWLTRIEAPAFAGVHCVTIGNWYRAGLLPHTDDTMSPHLILRGDLERVLRADRYNDHGVHYASLRGRLTS